MALSFPLLVLAKDVRGWRRAGGQERGRWGRQLRWHGAAWAMTVGALVLYLTFSSGERRFRAARHRGTGAPRRRLSNDRPAVPGPVHDSLALSVERFVDLRAAWVWPAGLGSVVFLAGMGVLCFRKRRSLPAAWEAFVAFFLFLGPVSNLIRLDYPMAERYLTLPLVALCYVLAHALARGLAPSPRRTVLAILVVAWTLVSWQRCTEWRSKRTLWEAEVRRGTKSAKAHANLGSALLAEQDFAEAEKVLREGVRLQPAHADSLYNLGAAEKALGRNEEAEAHLRKAIEVQPDYAMAHATLANLLAMLGRREPAAEECALALRYGTFDAQVQNNVGVTRMLLGDPSEAEKMFRASARMDPSQPQAFVDLGRVLAGKNQYDEAVALYRRALGMRPDVPEALEGLGIALASSGHPGDAVGPFQRWTQVQPDVPRAYLCLGTALGQANRRDEARRSLEQGLAVARQARDAQAAGALQQALVEMR